MRLLQLSAILLLAATGLACDGAVESLTQPPSGNGPEPQAREPQSMEATGTFQQTGITSLTIRQEGGNTILEQTSFGVISGTIDGTYEDDLLVVIHPDGRFNAKFTILATCDVEGREGTLEFEAQDRGQMVSETVGAFAGTAVITGGSGELADMQGVLAIEGAVDLTSGLSTYDYAGDVRLVP